jgi:hypothetical protein
VPTKALTALGVVVLLLTGCGSGKGASKSTTPRDNGALSGSDLGTQTLALVKSARSFRVIARSGTDAKGGHFTLDVRYGPDRSHGTVRLNKVTAELLGIGNVAYVKGSAAFWRTQLRGVGLAGFAPTLAGKWVKLAAKGSAFAQLASFTKRMGIVSELGAAIDPIMFSRGPRKTIRGIVTVSFIQTSDGTTVYVRADGQPYPVLCVAGPARGGGKVQFSGWNEAFAANAPPVDEVVDITSLGKR